MRRSIALGSLLLSLAFSASAQTPNDFAVSIQLRDTGYLLGDLLDEHVTIELPASFAIDAESLPLPGRVAPWLELRRAALGKRAASGAQELVVTYQIFAETEEAARVPLPEFQVQARSGSGAHAITIPSRTFLLSPGLPASLSDKDRELVPSPTPVPLPQSGFLFAAMSSLLLASACAAWLLWRYDRLPFLPYAPGPLARTWRRWRRSREITAEQHVALLRDVHAALNRSAGETLYPSTLHRLFERAPHLAPLRDRIASMFAASWRTFYESGPGAPPPAPSVLALLRDAADRERGVPC